jgi:hypothetical protein
MLTKYLGCNYRTTLIGFATAFFSFVVFDPTMFPHWLVKVAAFAMTGGFASMGILSKDAKNVKEPNVGPNNPSVPSL